MAKVRHVPQRSCVVCREVKAKPELTRLVRGTDGSVRPDPTGKLPGRGAYLCAACLTRDLRREKLEQALRGKIDAAQFSALSEMLKNPGPSHDSLS